MLKSLFFKHKAETDELLPPPPPFPSLELEEKPEEIKEPISEDQFEDLFNDVQKELDLEEKKAKEANRLPKSLSKKKLKKLSKIKTKEAKLKKRGVKKESAPKEEFYDLGKDLGFGPEQAEFQDLGELGIGNLKIEGEIKPKEIEEAEEEIASAIEGIKKYDNKSLFSGLFKKKAVPEQKPMLEIQAGDLDIIKKKINDARNALMNLDLEAAKNDYMEIIRLYNQLKPEEQAQVYHEIRDLYYERKSAEELKV